MTPIDAVLFDFGMVLCQAPTTVAWQQIETVLGCEEDRLQQEYWLERDAYDRGALTGETYWLRIAERLRVPNPVDAVSSLLTADINLWCEPNVPMMLWAQRLREAGVPTGLLSNLGDAIETGLRSRLPWLELFDHKIFSNNHGTAKPDRTIFEHAIHELGFPANRILFIDDRQENIAAARDAGLIAVEYLDHAAFVARLAELGHTGLPPLP